MSEQKSGIMLVADQVVSGKGLPQLLANENDLEVIAQTHSRVEAIQLAGELNPDLILLDLHLHDAAGIQTLKNMRQAGVTARIVMHAVSDAEEDVVDALNHGADGYLLKKTAPGPLLANIKRALSGEMVLSECIMHVLSTALRRPRISSAVSLNSLTNREYEILSLITQGKSNKVIARELHIADGTVKVHVRHVLKKLGAHSRVNAALWMVAQQSATL